MGQIESESQKKQVEKEKDAVWVFVSFEALRDLERVSGLPLHKRFRKDVSAALRLQGRGLEKQAEGPYQPLCVWRRHQRLCFWRF